ncbi:MAG TPA: polymer-forming cytoskeletal protein [Alphaproteobacteria bacterium]|nr:polymer-forming cytoskeletal protein [Alphaproteobacteria bacterium]
MFKRKDSDEDAGGKTSRDEANPRGGGVTPAAPLARPPGLESAEMANMPYQPVRPGAEPYRRVIEIPNPARRVETTLPAPAAKPESKKLIVGRDISLNGKIASCDRLIVEGRVEAELQDCHTIEIAESGTFKGAAEIKSAEVSGHYEGSLTVRENLLIHSTGQVSGTIRYGRLEIEEGGEINGDIKSLGSKGN